MAMAVAAFASQAASAATTAPLQAYNFGPQGSAPSQGVGFYSETSGSVYWATPGGNWLATSLGNRTPAVATTVRDGDRRKQMLERMSSRSYDFQMPPLGTELVDDDGLRVMKAWLSRF